MYDFVFLLLANIEVLNNNNNNNNNDDIVYTRVVQKTGRVRRRPAFIIPASRVG